MTESEKAMFEPGELKASSNYIYRHDPLPQCVGKCFDSPLLIEEACAYAQLFALAPVLLAACEATCEAIEFRGKHAMASWDELAEDESNWRDGVEPYLLDLYDKNRAIVDQVRALGGQDEQA